MKLQEAEFPNDSLSSYKIKTKGVILITDNRPKNTPIKSAHPDFRQSAFKCKLFFQTETEVDPLQAWVQNNIQYDQDSLIQELNRRLERLQARVIQLQRSSDPKEVAGEAIQQSKDKRHRRKFAQIQRQYICPNMQCQRVYGSQTSLKHHLKIKHQIQSTNEKENHNSPNIHEFNSEIQPNQ